MTTPSPRADLSRNDPCPCGSGKKYKKCCMGSASSAAAAAEPERGALLDAAHHALGRGEIARAEALFQHVLARHPADALALAGLGMIEGQRGEHERGLELLGRAAAIAPRETRIVYERARLLKSAGRSEEALREARRVLVLEPRHAGARQLAGKCCEALNRLDEAEKELARVLGPEPLDVDAGIVQARIDRRRGRLDVARERLEGILARATQPERRATAWRELGSVLTRQGEHARAFDAHAEAARERARTPQAGAILRASWRERVEAIRALPDALLDVAPPPRASGPERVFLVGFPRSGTTMLEQVLAAHPRVATTDERIFVTRVREAFERTLPPGLSLADKLAAVDEPARERLRAEYDALVAKELPDAPPNAVRLDKLPLNLLQLPWIQRIFPDAKILVALRDPRDCCLSAFMQDFALNEAMIEFLSLESSARFYAEVMSIWLDLRERIRLPWTEVRYEDVTRDLEGSARRVLEFLGLPWDERVLRFQERAAARAISTPSYAAVTEAVHTRAVGRWHAHAARFEPLQPLLAPFVRAFGYA